MRGKTYKYSCSRFLILFAAMVVLFVHSNLVNAENQTIKIGVVYAFSGAAQAFSEYGRMGLELARDEVNEAGGINGQKIELVFEDSRTNPAESVSAYRKLVAVDGVKVVIGNVWAFITNPLIPLSASDRVVLISPTVMPESVERTSDYFFSMGEHISNLSEAVDLFFKRNKDVKKVGVFCWDDTWGQAYLKVWREVAKRNGAEIDIVLSSIDFSNDYRADVAKMKSRNVDAVIISDFGERVLRRMKEQKFSPKVLGTPNLIEDLKLKNAPKELFEGIYLTHWMPSQDFIKKFVAKYNQEPLMFAHDSYEVLRSLSKALSANKDDILSELRKVKYQGVTGKIDFSCSHFANHGVAKLYQVHNGELDLVQ